MSMWVLKSLRYAARQAGPAVHFVVVLQKIVLVDLSLRLPGTRSLPAGSPALSSLSPIEL